MKRNLLTKVVYHFFHGDLFHIVKTIIYQKYYGRSLPIGDNYFGQKAKIYDEHRENDEFWQSEDKVLKEILDSLPEFLSVLDIPFGTGRFTPLYNKKQYLVTGLDSSQDMLDQAKYKYGDLLAKMSLDIGDAKNLPYINQQFDLLVCFRFLPWIVSFGDFKIILKELSRVCKEYAIIELCVGHPKISGKNPNYKLSLYDQLNEFELRELLLQFNFNTIKVYKIYDDEEHPGLSAFLCEKVE